ncbi:GspE/PulE family protein [Hyphomonas sp.]|uniref:GspE/PulE family protein n=1 Tax=Hyphomonas sp. TaxID=87 RepID=UPI0039194008
MTRQGSETAPAPGGGAARPADPHAALGALLIARGQLTDVKLSRALASSAKTGEPLASILVKLGLCPEDVVASALAGMLGIDHVRAGTGWRPAADLLGLKRRFLRDADIVPLESDSGAVVLAMADPLNEEDAKAVFYKTGRTLPRAAASRADVRAWLSATDPKEAAAEADPATGGAAEADIERLIDLARGAPVIRWVEDVLALAVEARASDIHIEPERDHLRVRIRVDGALAPVNLPLEGTPEAVVSRIKVLAKLNIAERRLPQDGRIRTALRGREIDLRVATMPSLHGETVALRLLDQSAAHLDLDALGLSALARERMIAAISKPEGITLVSGPTGSGKTTTLYACLRHLMNPQTKFMSVEDPVEYEIAGVSQIQVKPEIGMTFARALRSVLRHNPNVLMIGEIRDEESAQIAVEASLTGHMVLSTIHTNNAPATITRLLEMGIEDYLLSSTVNAVAAQRLLRVLCPACRQPAAPPPALAARLEAALPADMPCDWHGPAGCPECNGTGYRGRMSVAEVMAMSPALEEAILARAPDSRLRAIARQEGMRTLFEEAVLAAASGRTSLAEVFAVTGSGEP